VLEIIDDILSIIGIISLMITVVRIMWWLLSTDYEWYGDVIIKEEMYEVDYSRVLDEEMYSNYYRDMEEKNEQMSKFLIIPQNTIIRKLVIKKTSIESIRRGEHKFSEIKVYKFITPETPMCLVIPKHNAEPLYMVEWSIDYGAKACYYFCDNMGYGKKQLDGICYKKNFIYKLRKILELK